MRKYLTVERTCRGKTVVRKRGGRASLARKGRDGFTAVDSTWDLVGLGSFDAQRDLICDGDAVAFQRDDFFGMVGENPNVSEAEVDQDLRAYSAFVLHHALASGLAIELASLVYMNLWQRARLFGGIDGEATAGVMKIKEHAAIFFGDGFER